MRCTVRGFGCHMAGISTLRIASDHVHSPFYGEGNLAPVC